MITREQVADLRPGDVVEVASDRWPGVVMRGPLHETRGYLSVGPWAVRLPDGSEYLDLGETSTRTLTVVSRVPRLFANSDRTHLVGGDVARNADDDTDVRVWYCAEPEDTALPWFVVSNGEWTWAGPETMPVRLRLLVVGETGQAVP